MNITSQKHGTYSLQLRGYLRRDFLAPIRRRLNHIEFHQVEFAHLICRLIPPSCPFARDIRFFGYLLFQIPPLCKLNPLYEELMTLRFRALNYLAEANEDISIYLG